MIHPRYILLTNYEFFAIIYYKEGTIKHSFFHFLLQSAIKPFLLKQLSPPEIIAVHGRIIPGN